MVASSDRFFAWHGQGAPGEPAAQELPGAEVKIFQPFQFIFMNETVANGANPARGDGRRIASPSW
jgi:hypothetical protein